MSFSLPVVVLFQHFESSLRRNDDTRHPETFKKHTDHHAEQALQHKNTQALRGQGHRILLSYCAWQFLFQSSLRLRYHRPDFAATPLHFRCFTDAPHYSESDYNNLQFVYYHYELPTIKNIHISREKILRKRVLERRQKEWICLFQEKSKFEQLKDERM